MQAGEIDFYFNEHNLWLKPAPKEEQYLTHGAGASVYLSDDKLHVIKLNDVIYYAT